MAEPPTQAEVEAWHCLFAAISKDLSTYVTIYDHDRDVAWALGYGKSWQESPPV